MTFQDNKLAMVNLRAASQRPRTVADYHRLFAAMRPYSKRRTCDGLKAGSLDRKVVRVAVTWMATRAVIEMAAARRADLIICHEPLYYTHYDDLARRRRYPASVAKRALLTPHRIAVYRVHDVWDFLPKYGIHDSWVRQLGIFTPDPNRGPLMCRVKPAPFAMVLEQVRRAMGLQYVLACGDVSRMVRHVYLGIGAMGIVVVEQAVKHRADALIVGEQIEWEAVRLAEDSGLPMGLVGHCVSENAGMQAMVKYLEKQLPGPEYFFLDAGHPFRILA